MDDTNGRSLLPPNFQMFGFEMITLADFPYLQLPTREVVLSPKFVATLENTFALPKE